MSELAEIKVSLLKRDGKAVWYMQYRHPETGRKVPRTTKQTNKHEAQRVARNWETELRAGRDNRLGRIEWAEFRRRYEDEVLAGLAENTAKKMASVFNAVEEIISPAKLGNVTTDAMNRLQKELRDRKRSENTIKGYLAHIRAALAWAVDAGLLAAIPKIPKVQRAKSTNVMKGRPITTEELERMIGKIEAALMSTMATDKAKEYKRWTAEARETYLTKRREQAEDLAPSWAHLMRGLWWSGLRLTEALDLHWTDETKLHIDLSCRYPMLRIPAEREKGHKDRLLPIAPEFAQFILQTPAAKRHGHVFNPAALRADKQGQRLGEQQVGRIISLTGRLAKVKVNTDANGREKTGSAHDMRRSFGLRWSQRVMPQVLMELMRHESIDTTLRYYVGRNAQATASVLWEAAGMKVGALLGVTTQETKTAAEGGNHSAAEIMQ